MKFIILVSLAVVSMSACAASVSEPPLQSSTNERSANVGDDGSPTVMPSSSNEQRPAQAKQPRTVRDFFMLLPGKYFTLEGCDRENDKDCRRARIEYLERFAEVEDTTNGYLKGGCDGAQACMEMALFKRGDGSYLIGLATSAEMMNDFHFLEYRNNVWADVSSRVVPEYSSKNMYELPRYGTTVRVFAKKVIEKGADYEISEKGAKLYDLEWKNSRFVIKR